MNESTYRPQPVSFVRRGSRLQGRREKAWEEHREQYLVQMPRLIADTSVDPDYRFDAAQAFGREAELVLEVGSGLGEAIAHAAAQTPERNFLAVEVYLPGLAQTVQRAAALGLDNVRVVQANAPEVLATACEPGSLAEVWTFFPDPWHKSRHEKRRLVTPAFAELVADALAPGGVWRLATDWEHYAEQMLEVGEGSSLQNLHQDWAPRFEGRIVTSFENKALKAGRTIRDLTFRKAG
ncbi:tRNA (guanosine(46)-N7)-methyltransferase TrmB [Psychromicrobium xiongbiense]|uniref:tRNA (guanosine(46)-N7)-methyltransferase TrmB n=1 Tax=Psychromicrobium xiongbiense TaxID=3051184 RepID=UPI002553EB39|nr:tRNA (guanosine(46)-N7)-methyltransferase TrmB [Psychromicrobium sp. YIM S02556]